MMNQLAFLNIVSRIENRKNREWCIFGFESVLCGFCGRTEIERGGSAGAVVVVVLFLEARLRGLSWITDALRERCWKGR